MRGGLLFAALGLALTAAAGCLPEPGEPPSLILAPRVLALRSEPAEALPGQAVTLRLLRAAPVAAPPAADLEWAFCTTAKPPVDDNVISEACLGDAAQVVAAGLAAALPVLAALPADGCAQFGPELPPARVGDPPARPREPDSTGGYYQPVRARLSHQATIGLVRIQCGLAGASAELAAAYRQRYQPNRNPQLLQLELSDLADGMPLRADALPRGHVVQLRLTVTAESAEHFVVLQPETQTLVEQTESLQAAWFATAGSFALAHTAALPGQAELRSRWSLPDQPGPAALWVVLRDSRGGVDWLELAVAIY